MENKGILEIYTKIPIKVRAIEWIGTNLELIKTKFPEYEYFEFGDGGVGELVVKTVDGWKTVNLHDYIVEEETGRVYVVPKHVFLTTHNKVNV